MFSAKEKGLKPYYKTVQKQKVMELRSEAIYHKLIIIVDELRCGKTSTIKLLKETRLLMQSVSDSYPIIDKVFISPGMHSNSELFRFIDTNTGKANEGVIADFLETTNTHQNTKHGIFSTAKWIDALVPAFDNVHMLTFNTGGTCPISDNTKFI